MKRPSRLFGKPRTVFASLAIGLAMVSGPAAAAQYLTPVVENALSMYRLSGSIWGDRPAVALDWGDNITTYLRPDTGRNGSAILAISVDVYDDPQEDASFMLTGDHVVAETHLREYDCAQGRVRIVEASTIFTDREFKAPGGHGLARAERTE